MIHNYSRCNVNCPCENGANNCLGLNNKRLVVRFTGVRSCSDDSLLVWNDADICLIQQENPDVYFGYTENGQGIYYLLNDGLEQAILSDQQGAYYFNGKSSICAMTFNNGYTKDMCKYPRFFWGYGGSAVIEKPFNCGCEDAPQWHVGLFYNQANLVLNDTSCYHCIQEHISVDDNESGVGVNWEDYWELIDIEP
jgi:hypothetical protein